MLVFKRENEIELVVHVDVHSSLSLASFQGALVADSAVVASS